MRQIQIKETNNPIQIDIDKLIETRLLVQANSGGGKSYCLRKIIEECAGKVQQVILDMEGEFHTLREKHDFILVGKDGDIDIDVRHAETLAREILRLNASVIIDLYELKQHERIRFVKLFLDSMINAPKELWHPCLVYVDEAHVFCPEAKSGRAESSGSVIDIMTRGRKHGLGGILATQRLSKLNKDACAECNNKLLGRTGLDIDRKRVSEELGFTKKDQSLSLRNLGPGEFYAFGPAISQEVIKAQINQVKTTHPKIGSRQLLKQTVTPTTAKIKSMLDELIKLPQKAEKELKTIKEYKQEIHKLKFELRTATKSQSKIPTLKDIADKKSERIELFNRGIKHGKQWQINHIKKRLNKFSFDLVTDISLSNKIQKITKKKVVLVKDLFEIIVPHVHTTVVESKTPDIVVPKHVPTKEDNVYTQKEELPMDTYANDKISGGALRMLKASAMFHPNKITRARMGAIAGLSFKSGSFGTYLATLKRNRYITGEKNEFTITEQGLEIVGNVEPLPRDPEHLINMWANIVKGGAGRMLRTLADNYPNSITKEELGEKVSMSHTSGSFGTYLATLKRNGLITVDSQEVKASDELFD